MVRYSIDRYKDIRPSRVNQRLIGSGLLVPGRDTAQSAVQTTILCYYAPRMNWPKGIGYADRAPLLRLRQQLPRDRPLSGSRQCPATTYSHGCASAGAR
jgi:hypothetical protein